MIVSGTVVGVLVVVGLLGLTVLFWHYVVAVFADHIIPFFRTKLGGRFGPIVADGLANLISWLDGKVTLVRSAVASVWRLFKQRVLGMKATYRKTSATTAAVETEATLAPEATDKRKVRVQEREVPLADLPEEVRKQLELGAPAVEVDVTDTVARRVAARAAEQGIPPQELDLQT